MKPNIAPGHRPGHGHAHAPPPRLWRRRALVLVAATAGAALLLNFALLAPLARHDAAAAAAGGGAAGAGGANGVASGWSQGYLESFDSDGDGVLDANEYRGVVAVRPGGGRGHGGLVGRVWGVVACGVQRAEKRACAARARPGRRR
jgi:uncharacterized membrane protein